MKSAIFGGISTFDFLVDFKFDKVKIYWWKVEFSKAGRSKRKDSYMQRQLFERPPFARIYGIRKKNRFG